MARYLYFDIGTLFKSLGDYFFPTLIRGAEYDAETVGFGPYSCAQIISPRKRGREQLRNNSKNLNLRVPQIGNLADNELSAFFQDSRQ